MENEVICYGSRCRACGQHHKFVGIEVNLFTPQQIAEWKTTKMNYPHTANCEHCDMETIQDTTYFKNEEC